MVGSILAVAPLIGVLAVLALREPTVSLRPAFVLVLVLLVLVGPALGIGLVLLVRRRGAGWAQPSPVMGLTRLERKHLLRALRRGDPVPTGYEDVAAHLVGQIRRARWLPLLCWSACLLQVVHIRDGGFAGRFGMISFAVGVVGLGYSFWTHHKIASRTDF
ncbi:MAG: hypothetical protein LC789_03355 [Actinobacteria bacterium]|nr:hypothetical protein [Actinomycetota bacterium]